MAYQISVGGQIAFVRMSERVSCDERLVCLDELLDTLQAGPCQAILIDYEDAEIDTDKQKAFEFGTELGLAVDQLADLKIVAIAPGANRDVVGISATGGLLAGVPLKVCHSRDDALETVMSLLGGLYHGNTSAVT